MGITAPSCQSPSRQLVFVSPRSLALEPHPRSSLEARYWACESSLLPRWCHLHVTHRPRKQLCPRRQHPIPSSSSAPEQGSMIRDSGPRGGCWERFPEFQWPWKKKQTNLINISSREKKDLTDKLGSGWSRSQSGGISGLSPAPRPPQPGPVSRRRLSVPPGALGESETPQLWPRS